MDRENLLQVLTIKGELPLERTVKTLDQLEDDELVVITRNKSEDELIVYFRKKLGLKQQSPSLNSVNWDSITDDDMPRVDLALVNEAVLENILELIGFDVSTGEKNTIIASREGASLYQFPKNNHGNSYTGKDLSNGKIFSISQLIMVEGYKLKEFIKSNYNIDDEKLIVSSLELARGVQAGKANYYKTDKNGMRVAISNFLIQPNFVMWDDSSEQLVLNYNIVAGKTYGCNMRNREMSFDDFIKKDIFLKKIAPFSFIGTPEELTAVKDIILNDYNYESYSLVPSIGLQRIAEDKYVFVDQNGDNFSLEEHTFQKFAVRKNEITITTNILNIPEITKDELIELDKRLFSFNLPTKAVPIIMSTASTFLKPKLRDLKLGKLHHLQLIGEAGSGKSNTLKEICMNIHSASRAVTANVETAFTIGKGLTSSNLTPYFIDEFKSSTMQKGRRSLFGNILRQSYDYIPFNRGNKDQSMKEYDLRAPIIIAGENEIEETSIIERSLIINFYKSDIDLDGGASKETVNYEWLRANRSFLQKFGKSLLAESMRWKDSEFTEAMKKISSNKGLYQKIKNERGRDTMVNLVLGMELVKKVYERCGLGEMFDSERVKDFLSHCLEAISEFTFKGQKTSRTILENTLEVFDRMVANGVLYNDEDFKTVSKKDELALDLTRLYDKFTEYISKRNIEMEFYSQKQFASTLRKSKYFSGYKAVRFESKAKNIKCYCLKIDELKKTELQLDRLLGVEHQEEF